MTTEMTVGMCVCLCKNREECVSVCVCEIREGFKQIYETNILICSWSSVELPLFLSLINARMHARTHARTHTHCLSTVRQIT